MFDAVINFKNRSDQKSTYEATATILKKYTDQTLLFAAFDQFLHWFQMV